MITLHHLENSQSIKILWLLEELGLDYELKKYPRDPATQLAPASYKSVSPLGTAPVLTDGDLTLAESNAIIEYIVTRYGQGRLRPAADAPEYPRYLFWFHASQASLQLLLTMNTVFAIVQKQGPFFLRPVARMLLGAISKRFAEPRLEALLALMEKDLEKGDWLAGDALTAADIAMVYAMHSLPHFGGLDARFPRAQAYLQRIRACPSFQRALKHEEGFQGPPVTG